MSWPEASARRPGANVPTRSAEFAQTLKQHVQDGLSPDLALDLVLNELVVAAASLTHASAAAVALARGDEMVCRATTGDHAPELGIPIHTLTGLSGACVHSRSPQYCRDTEADDRVDPDVSHRLGIRSILVVPILELNDAVGIIEVFSRQPSPFSEADVLQLQEFAVDCLKLRQLSVELAQRPPHKLEEPGAIGGSVAVPATTTRADDRLTKAAPFSPKVEQDSYAKWETLETFVPAPEKRRSRIDTWTLVLAALLAAAAISLVFLIAYRLRWVGTFASHPVRVQAPHTSAPEQDLSAGKLEPSKGKNEEGLVVTSQPGRPVPPASGGLVIYELGKVIYRSQPTTSTSDLHTPPSVTSAHKIARVWLSSSAAEARLRDRVEPEYPAEARAANRSGDVTLQVLVREDGSVASVRTVKGDRLLAAAATVAVRNWHYEPYRVKGHAKEFETNVTLRFSLSQ